MALTAPRCCLTLLLLSFSGSTIAQMITVLRSLSDYQPSKVVLLCSTPPDSNSAVEFYRRVGPDRHIVNGTSTTFASRVELSIELTPEMEGHYYCQVGNIPSDIEVELVAYPIVDPMLNARTVYPTSPGDDIILRCPYKRGELKERYSVNWYRGLTPINLAAPEYSRYSVLEDLSLMINNTEPNDGRGYSCEVEVTIDERLIRKFGPVLSLEVIDPIRITHYISDTAVKPGKDARFTCTAVGVPQPNIKWLIGSKEVEGDKNIVVTSTLDSITVESTLRLTGVGETQTGPLSCVAYHSYNGEVKLAISTANLVVLTDNFAVSLTSETNGDVRLQATLPAIIPGVFSLVVHFIFNVEIIQVKEIIHPTFTNTNVINYVIPEEQLPQFRQFGVKVALKFGNVEGRLTPETGKITLPTELPSRITGGDCECPQFPESTASPANGSTPIIASVLVIIVVLLFIVVGFLVGYVLWMHTCKKGPDSAVTASPVYYHESGSFKRGDSQGSLSRSISRASYNSDHSRSSGRSRGSSYTSRSSRSSCSSYSRGGSRAGSSQGTLESVKENLSLNHKELAQWGGEVEREPMASPASPDRPPPQDSRYEEVRYESPRSNEDTEFKPPQSREEVFHTNVPYATNPTAFVIKYEKKKLRHSDSSYEDMELDQTPLPQPPFKTK